MVDGITNIPFNVNICGKITFQHKPTNLAQKEGTHWSNMVQQIIPETTKRNLYKYQEYVTLTDSHIRCEFFDDLVNRSPRNWELIIISRGCSPSPRLISHTKKTRTSGCDVSCHPPDLVIYVQTRVNVLLMIDVQLARCQNHSATLKRKASKLL